MTTHDSLAGISRHFTGDEIEALVMTAAEAVCGNPDDLSTRQADLAGRAYRLLMDGTDEPPAAEPPPRAALPSAIWVLRHDDTHGDDVSLYASRESALGALAQTVRSRWDNISDMPGVPATGDGLDDESAVATYFSHRSGSESYSLYSEDVNGTHAGTCPGGTGDPDDKLRQLSSQSYEASQQIALVSMLAIARITRATLPDAAVVSLAWSDQGRYLIPGGGYLTRDGQRIAEDASFSEDSLDNAISLYCASLGEDNEGTWQAFTSTGTADQAYHLKLDDVLASAEPATRQLVPGQPPPRCELTGLSRFYFEPEIFRAPGGPAFHHQRPAVLRSPLAQRASCRNLVGYIRSVRHWEDEGYPQLADEVRRIIADIWADRDPPAVSGFQQDLARRFLAGEDVGV